MKFNPKKSKKENWFIIKLNLVLKQLQQQQQSASVLMAGLIKIVSLGFYNE